MSDKTDREGFMRRAIALSEEHMSAGHGGPFGAVIVRNSEIVGEGWNQVTTATDPTAHAEMVAIRAAAHRLGTHNLSGCELYTSCEPCPMCLAAVYWARVDRIWYANDRIAAAAIGFDDSYLYGEVATPLSERQIPIAPLLPDEAARVFQAWLEKPDRVHY